jgi:hypothetical protein
MNQTGMHSCSRSGSQNRSWNGTKTLEGGELEEHSVPARRAQRVGSRRSARGEIGSTVRFNARGEAALASRPHQLRHRAAGRLLLEPLPAGAHALETLHQLIVPKAGLRGDLRGYRQNPSASDVDVMARRPRRRRSAVSRVLAHSAADPIQEGFRGPRIVPGELESCPCPGSRFVLWASGGDDRNDPPPLFCQPSAMELPCAALPLLGAPTRIADSWLMVAASIVS